MARELKDKDLITEPRNPMPTWIWLAIITAAIALLWGGKSFFKADGEEKYTTGPFSDVTNREFSQFLWQNPEYMRANVSGKSSYLEGFQYLNKVTIEPDLADQRVKAPPKVVFLYHTWNRLLGEEYFPRKIGPSEFRDFLNYAEEWRPEYWKNAPEDYKRLVAGLDTSKVENLDTLPTNTLPFEVRKAFQGWKNYLMEGEAIDKVQPTFEEMSSFLKLYPNYARNFWRNIQGGEKSDYLKSIASGKFDPKGIVPEKELAAFLKVAFYNWKQSLKKS